MKILIYNGHLLDPASGFDAKADLAIADGKVVVIEQTQENEYFQDKRLMISIFMSPFNVHCNWYPVSGRVSYLRYHEGKYLVAWHPKASTENERTTIVIEKDNKVYIIDFGDAYYIKKNKPINWFLQEVLDGYNGWNPDFK